MTAADPAAREPVADLCVPADLGWAEHLRELERPEEGRTLPVPAPLDREAYRLTAHALVDAVRRRMRGEPAPDLKEHAIRLGVWGPVPSTQHAPLPTDALPPVDHLARVATDMCPDASSEAPDWALGPWVEGLDPRDRLHRRALVTAIVWHGFTERDDGLTSFDRWARTQEVPSPLLRARMRAVAQAPVGIWEITALDAGSVTVTDRVGFPAAWVPSGPIPYEDPGGVAGGARVGGALVGRAVRTEAGWVLASAFAVPSVPDRRRIGAWIALEALPARLLWRRRTLEELLARRGPSLARAVHEWAWSARV